MCCVVFIKVCILCALPPIGVRVRFVGLPSACLWWALICMVVCSGGVGLFLIWFELCPLRVGGLCFLLCGVCCGWFIIIVVSPASCVLCFCRLSRLVIVRTGYVTSPRCGGCVSYLLSSVVVLCHCSSAPSLCGCRCLCFAVCCVPSSLFALFTGAAAVLEVFCVLVTAVEVVLSPPRCGM